MLRKLLESKGFKINDEEFESIMCMVTEDLKFNNITFKKRTSIEEVLAIAQMSAIALRRCS